MQYILAIVFALLATPAAADPISIVIGAIGAAGSWLLSGTVLANIVLGGLLVAAKYALGTLFQSKPKSQASATETKYGENLVREVGLGTFGTRGHHVYRNAFDKGNHIVQDVYKLSDFRCTELLRVQMDGEWKLLSATDEGDEGRIYGRRVLGVHEGGQVFVRFYSGTLSQTADPALIAYANPTGRWTSAHRGAGICYVVVTTITDVDNLTSVPSLLFEVKGAPLYDPRKDSTVGGSGAHRWNDQSTWEYTSNPAVMMYNLERGIYHGTEKIVGRGVPASQLPLSEWMTAMNICDEAMADGSKRYTAALIASSGDGVTHDTNMTPLREACAASWVEGVIGEYPIVGANQAVVATITDDDIAWDKPFQLSLTRPRSELVNTVAATYISPDKFYETTSLATRVDDTALAQDRERLAAKIDYTAVTDPRVGDRLADIAIRASRYQAHGSYTIHPKYLGVQVGQWISWVSARYGFTKKLQIQSKALGALGSDGTRDVRISWQEVGDGIFDPTAYTTTPPVITPNAEPAYLAAVENFNAVPNIVLGATGDQLPGIRLYWDEITDGTVVGVDIQYWPVSDPTQIFSAYVTRDVTVYQIVNGLTSQTEWQIRTRLRAAPGTRPVAWTAPVNVLTLGIETNLPPIDFAKLDEDINGYLGWASDGLRYVLEELDRIGSIVANQDAANYSDKQQIRREITSTSGSLTAKFTEEIIAATGPGSAIAQRIESLEVAVEDDIATAVSNLTTQINTVDGRVDVVSSNVTALQATVAGKADASAVSLLSATVSEQGDMITSQGNAIIDLQSQVNGVSASATFRAQTVAAPSGWNSRIALQARVGTSDSYKNAGIYFDVTPTNSRIVVSADQFVVTDGANTVQPLIATGGVVYLTNVRLGTLKFDQLESNNGKLIMRGYGSYADIRIWT
ncbi:phage tail protein [Daeguia caeni]|uniref:Phage tail protein n=1 Tax=Daeguia caeni TaxID=439612 RepID=A0ABV9H528_9HYPH